MIYVENQFDDLVGGGKIKTIFRYKNTIKI